ncbi:MAG TPA: hypothetical protein VGB73_14370 [Pyrinomonadaceae bacterium]|jgi:hypothetical protein
MPGKTEETKKPTRRTQVRELPKQEKELSQDEQKRVKGGLNRVNETVTNLTRTT